MDHSTAPTQERKIPPETLVSSGTFIYYRWAWEDSSRRRLSTAGGRAEVNFRPHAYQAALVAPTGADGFVTACVTRYEQSGGLLPLFVGWVLEQDGVERGGRGLAWAVDGPRGRPARAARGLAWGPEESLRRGRHTGACTGEAGAAMGSRADGSTCVTTPCDNRPQEHPPKCRRHPPPCPRHAAHKCPPAGHLHPGVANTVVPCLSDQHVGASA